MREFVIALLGCLIAFTAGCKTNSASSSSPPTARPRMPTIALHDDPVRLREEIDRHITKGMQVSEAERIFVADGWRCVYTESDTRPGQKMLWGNLRKPVDAWVHTRYQVLIEYDNSSGAVLFLTATVGKVGP